MITCTESLAAPSAPPTSLDPPETSPQPAESSDAPADRPSHDRLKQSGVTGDSLSQVFRHSGWARQRKAVNAALIRTHQSASRIMSFQSCGYGAYVLKSYEDPPRYRVAGCSCHDRFCQVCAAERSQAIALNVSEKLGSVRARFVTLTLRQTPIGLQAAIDRLYECFRQLQRLKFWRERVKGGVGFLELKHNHDAGLWNVHLHLLVQGKFLPQKLLSRTWHAVTGDSYIVDVRMPKGKSDVVRYVTKYASKPLNTSYVFDAQLLDEALLALKGRRLCTTFGGWRGVLLVNHPDEDAWENLGSLESWILRAANGDDQASAILDQVNPDRASRALDAVPPPEPRPPPPAPQSIDTQADLFILTLDSDLMPF